MTILITILVWLLIGDLLLALRRWESEDPGYRIIELVIWPTTIWWVLRDLIREWRTDLYYRTKHL